MKKTLEEKDYLSEIRKRDTKRYGKREDYTSAREKKRDGER